MDLSHPFVAMATFRCNVNKCNGSCLKTGQHSIFIISYKENKKYIRMYGMLDILFIGYFKDIMEQYFHY